MFLCFQGLQKHPRVRGSAHTEYQPKPCPQGLIQPRFDVFRSRISSSGSPNQAWKPPEAPGSLKSSLEAFKLPLGAFQAAIVAFQAASYAFPTASCALATGSVPWQRSLYLGNKPLCFGNRLLCLGNRLFEPPGPPSPEPAPEPPSRFASLGHYALGHKGAQESPKGPNGAQEHS